MLSGLEFELYLMLAMVGFLLNLGYALIAGVEALQKSSGKRALQFAGAFLVWVLLSAGFAVLVFFQELARSQYGEGVGWLRLVFIGYLLISLAYWRGQRRLRVGS